MSVGQILMAVSFVSNIFLGWAYLGQRDAAKTAAVERSQAQAAATACSDATDGLRKLADLRKAEADKSRSAALDAARKLQQRADRTLSRQPKNADNACASLQALGDEWLQERKP